MKRIDLLFLLLAALALLVGVSMGIVMAARHDFQLSPVHAHLNLVGWTSLGLYGLVYRAYPALMERRIASVHLMLAGPAAFLLPVGIAFAILREAPLLATVAAFMWLAGVLIFLAQIISLFAGAKKEAIDPAFLPAEKVQASRAARQRG